MPGKIKGKTSGKTFTVSLINATLCFKQEAVSGVNCVDNRTCG